MAKPGIHPDFNYEVFSGEEQKIIKRFSQNWFVTSSPGYFKLSEKSVYRAFLGKPCEPSAQMFNLEREIITVFSNYEEFEVRTLGAFDVAARKYPPLRTDPICRILISRDQRILEHINDIVKDDPELPVIIPFTYEELLTNQSKHLILNRFRQHFFSRDLFAFENPLKRDTYFFGRTDLINNIISRHQSNENSALFGLRRSGKTSIVFGLERASKLHGQSFVLIDCQSPSVHQRNWHQLLPYVLEKIVEKYSLKRSLVNTKNYDEINASDQFYEDIKNIFLALKRSPIIIAFDEIERISPKTGSSEHWSKGKDFILFWQALRSAFQRHSSVFSYFLIGTNPQCIETSIISGHDNPIFNGVPIQYLSGFNEEQTADMVKKLGIYMGLRFPDTICAKLFEDFGGHPYLIRHVCSIINKKYSGLRPVDIDKTVYEDAKTDFELNYSHYTEMILNVLVRDYPDEFLMLDALATGDQELFNAFADDSSLTSHLIGYGLIEKGINGFYFKIESVCNHLQKKTQFTKTKKHNEDRLSEVAERRLRIEPALRQLVFTIYMANFGKNASKEAIQFLNGVSKKRLEEREFTTALQATSKDLNFSDLSKLIIGKWDFFSNLISLEKMEFEFFMEAIRKARTEEAHSGKISKNDFEQVRIAFTKIENELKSAGFLRV